MFQKNEESKKEAKPNLGSVQDATDRHVGKAVQIRKDKREERIGKLRRGQRNALTLNPQGSDLLQTAVKTYNKTLFLEHGSFVQFEALQTIFHEASDDQLEREFFNLVIVDKKPLVIHKLVSALRDAKQKIARSAAIALAEITGANTMYAQDVAAVVFDACRIVIEFGIGVVTDALHMQGFLPCAVAHLEQKSPICEDIWMILSNLVCVGPEARDVVFSFPNMGNLYVTQLSMGDTGGYGHPLLTIMAGSVQYADMPTTSWIATMWPYLDRYTRLMLPEPMREMNLAPDDIKVRDFTVIVL